MATSLIRRRFPPSKMQTWSANGGTGSETVIVSTDDEKLAARRGVGDGVMSAALGRQEELEPLQNGRLTHEHADKAGLVTNVRTCAGCTGSSRCLEKYE